jgi:hypothetical protein
MLSRSRPNTCWAYFVANGRPLRAWVTTMPRSKTPEQIRMNASRSRCAVSMPACTLNTKALKGSVSARVEPSAAATPVGAGASPTRVSSSAPTPKFDTADANRTGVVTPSRNSDCSWSWPLASSSSTSSTACCHASPSRTSAASAESASSGAIVAPPAVRVKRR